MLSQNQRVVAHKKKSINQKIPSGIPGFDEISHGGLPVFKTTLISGSSGSGKTVLCSQFLYKGIVDYEENGVFVTFEEKANDIMNNTKNFGWNIRYLIKQNKWFFVDASPDDTSSMEVGHYDLGGFLARIEYAINKVNATRIAIDSVSTLFTHFQDPSIIRRELYRIVSWLKKKKITCLMTAERPIGKEEQITRYGVEEFVSDNVILLHNRLNEKGERDRTIEILKFRGSMHDSEEAPLIINESGASLYPRPKPLLQGRGFSTRMSTGVKGLDELLHGGVYKNSTTLLIGASGTGKTVTTLHFIMEGARRREKSLLIEFEESPDQLFRNAASFGWDLKKYVENGTIKLICHYPEDFKAEQYLKMIQDIVIESKAKRVALDSLSAIQRIYNEQKFREFVIGLNAYLKMQNVTSLMTNTTCQLLGVTQLTETHLSTATDNIIILKYVELNGYMRRLVSVLKQRGGMHQKALVEFEITPKSGMTVMGQFTGMQNLMGGAPFKYQPLVDVTEQMTKIDLLRKEFVSGQITKTEFETKMKKFRKEIEVLQNKGF